MFKLIHVDIFKCTDTAGGPGREHGGQSVGYFADDRRQKSEQRHHFLPKIGPSDEKLLAPMGRISSFYVYMFPLNIIVISVYNYFIIVLFYFVVAEFGEDATWTELSTPWTHTRYNHLDQFSLISGRLLVAQRRVRLCAGR